MDNEDALLATAKDQSPTKPKSKKKKKKKQRKPSLTTDNLPSKAKPITVVQVKSQRSSPALLSAARAPSAILPTTDSTPSLPVAMSDDSSSQGKTLASEAPSTSADTPLEGLSTGYYKMLLETRRADQLCQSLGLTYRHVAKLKAIFAKEDSFGTGEITQNEFFTVINEEKRTLTKGIFAHVGLGPSPRRLSFDDYVICVCTFASLSRVDLFHYAFALFDADASGAMDTNELKQFCGDLRNKGFFFGKNVDIAQQRMTDKENAKKAVAGGDGLVDFEDIAKGSTQFQAAFFPIQQIQRNIQESTLGESVWAGLVQRAQCVEVLVHYMRLHDGHLPSLTWRERFRLLFNGELRTIRKIAINKYAEELRLRQTQQQSKLQPIQSEGKSFE